MDTRALAPSPDYRCDLPPDVEICSCDEALALREQLARMHALLMRRAARAATVEAVPLFDRAFCPMCGVGVGFDDDGCCTTCGATVCALHHLVAHLAAEGLSVVGAELAASGAGDGAGI